MIEIYLYFNSDRLIPDWEIRIVDHINKLGYISKYGNWSLEELKSETAFVKNYEYAMNHKLTHLLFKFEI